MPVIRIDDETWEALKKWAEPLEDTPSDALKKALKAADPHIGCVIQTPLELKPVQSIPEPTAKRANRGTKVHVDAYNIPILEAVHSLGGSAQMAVVLEIVWRKMEKFMTAYDKEMLPAGGDTRWHNTAQWSRRALVERGFLQSDSPRGIWALTDRGVKAVEDKLNI